jgi:hypothetical protein
MLFERVTPQGLTGLCQTNFNYGLARRDAAKVVIETGDAMHFGTGEVKTGRNVSQAIVAEVAITGLYSV